MNIEQNQELPKPRKVNSWQDLAREDFLRSLENPDFYQHLLVSFPHANLRIFSKVQGYYADGKPAAIAAWNPYSGDLEIHHYIRGKDDLEKIVRGVTTIVPGINLNRIRLYKDNTGSLYISDLELRQMFLVEDYLRFKKITGSNATLVVEMLNLLPVSEEPKQLRVYEKGNRFYLPSKSEIFVRDGIVQNLINAFDVVGTHEEYQKALNELWPLLSPKQKADFVALLGIPTINLLIDLRKLSYTKSYMLSYGSTKTGKTWLYRVGMKLLWGFDLLEGSAFWQGDSIGSQYRLHAILSSTNLPIYLDEVESRSKEIVDILKAAAVGATSFRGTASQSQITYLDTATLTATAQHNVYLSSKLALADELAILRRFYYNSYESGDADQAKVHEHVLFESKLKVKGLAYDILSQYTIDQLVGIVDEIMQQTGDDTTTAGLILGAELLGLDEQEFKNLKWGGNRDITPQEQVYELIRRDAVIVSQATISGTLDRDYVARNLSTLIGVKEKNERQYIVVTSAYIDYVNSQVSNPLKDKLHSLSDLKELEPLFSEEELKALPVRIYEREYRERFNGKVMSVAVLPYEYSEGINQDTLDNVTLCNTNVTQNVTHIFISINNKMLHSYTINNTFYNNSTESHININQNLCNKPQNSQNSSTLSRQNFENMEKEACNDNVTLCNTSNEPQTSNAATPQTPTKPTTPDNAPTYPNNLDNTPLHLDAQAQANQQVLSPQPAGPALANSAQTQQQATVMLSKTMQQEVPAEPQEQPTLSKEEIAQRVYLAVKLSERDHEPFWSDSEQKQLNGKLILVLQNLSTDTIKDTLKALQWQGYIMQVKPNHWHAVKGLHLVDLLAYDNPNMPVYCPNCMKPVSKLYWYDTEWLCVDCLNARQHQNDELYA